MFLKNLFTKRLTLVDKDDPILRSKCQLITTEEIGSKQLNNIIDGMFKVMMSHKGVGLAAPQVGINKCIAVINPNIVLINPRYTGNTWFSNKMEGCLSVPNKIFKVRRYKYITVNFLDRDGESRIWKIKKKELSTVIQHEVDHLNGILISEKGKLVYERK